MITAFLVSLVVLLAVGLLAIFSSAKTVIPGQKLSLDEAVLRMADAIAQFETGCRRSPFPFSDTACWTGRAKRNNNPGNLRGSSRPGAQGKDGAGYVIFDTPVNGWRALLFDVKQKIRGQTITKLGPWSTIAEFISVYAPEVDANPTGAYIAFVSAQVGVGPDVPFREWVEV